MTRQRGQSGRTTGPKESAHSVDSGIPPLRKRRPVMFWFIVFAALAMVLSTVSSFVSLLL